jgi:hypothetical protein
MCESCKEANTWEGEREKEKKLMVQLIKNIILQTFSFLRQEDTK